MAGKSEADGAGCGASCVVRRGLWAVGCGQVARVPQESSGVTEEELLGICLDLSEVSQAEDE